MKILICCINYRPEIISTGRYCTDLAEFLAARGHPVEVVTTAPHYPGWKAFPPYSNRRYGAEVLNGVRVRRAPMYLDVAASGFKRLLMPFTFALAASPLLLWRGLTWRPDVVLAVQPTIFAAPPALAAALLGGARTAQHVQDLEIDTAMAVGHVAAEGAAKRLVYAVERFVLRRFDQTVTISEAMRVRLVDKGIAADRIAVIRNWVDNAQIQPLAGPSPYRRELSIADDAFVVLYSGQWGRKQALHLIAEAAALLRDDPRFVFVVAGDGPMRPYLEEQAAALANLRLLPLQPTDRFNSFLALADCHLLPQDAGVSELVLPSKLGGMLASGRRILITADRDSELHAFLGDEAATFIPPGDPAAIAARLRAMIAEPDGGVASRAGRAAALDAAALLPRFEAILTELALLKRG